MTILSQHDPNTQDVPQFTPIEPRKQELEHDGETYTVVSLTARCHVLEHEGRLIGTFTSMAAIRRYLELALS